MIDAKDLRISDLKARLKLAQEDLSARIAELEKVESEREGLRAWKESALAVEREWDANALAVMLGAKPGESHRKVIAREVPKLLARVKRLEETGDRMVIEGIYHQRRKIWTQAKEAKP